MHTDPRLSPTRTQKLPTPEWAKRVKTESNKEPEEKRVRGFRPNPPQAFNEANARALLQRLYVLGRTRRDVLRRMLK